VTDTEETEQADVVDNTPADVRSWGLSGQPSTWALSTWGPLIEMIRLANRGGTDEGAVQDALDATFPDRGYAAGDVMLAHPPVGDFTVTDTETGVHVELAGDADLELPVDNVTWEFGDGTDAVHAVPGCDHDYPVEGLYTVTLTLAVGGALYGSTQEVGTQPDPVPDPVLDPGVAGRAATVFESTTDDLPNNSVPETEAEPVSDEAYDPAEHTVDEVLAYAEEHPDEVDDIAAAEEAGKNRTTLLDKL
jgi:hypothetical protein